MINNRKSISSLVGLLLLLPSISFAHGDPMIVYAFVSYAIAAISVAMYLLTSKQFRNLRWSASVIFWLIAVITSIWALNVTGPDFTSMYIGLTAPFITFAFLVKISNRFKKEQ